ncbi:MAG: dihydrodipicolinate synthase family protein [Bdellovibrionota bacterium]
MAGFKFTLPIDTPLNPDGTTHLRWLKSVIDWYSEHGCRRFLIDGTTGGWYGAGLADRIDRDTFAVEQIRIWNGYSAVNVASGTVSDSIRLAMSFDTRGPDLFVAMLPGVPTARTDKDIVTYFEHLSAGLPVNVPWALYEFGSLLGPRLSPGTLRQILAGERPPCAIKWTDPADPTAALKIAKEFHSETFRVIPSHERAIVDTIQMGLPEFVSGALILYPELVRAFEENTEDGDKLDLCQQLCDEWLDEMKKIADELGLGVPHVLKLGLRARLDGYPLDMPLGFSAPSTAYVDRVRRTINDILGRIPD